MQSGSVAKSGAKQKRAQTSDNRWGQASPCVFEDLGGRVGLVKNIQGLAWPPTGKSLSWPKNNYPTFRHRAYAEQPIFAGELLPNAAIYT
jgi:hypothetical protein